ncbi:Hypothetical_protein [Hexamita inflata]|uniref:Hypothetical_protein n=1 Tax=Hexamita inflata TaxID=28002 RepID=A0AA86N5X0_9EUKA|nr:Hypothetical protein HINF_LOCUS784 [Hexamita inflata]
MNDITITDEEDHNIQRTVMKQFLIGSNDKHIHEIKIDVIFQFKYCVSSIITDHLITSEKHLKERKFRSNFEIVTIGKQYQLIMNISGSTNIGGYFMSSLYLIFSSKIQLVRLFGSGVGIVIGQNANGVYSISGSSSQNYVNDVLQNNCTVLTNWQTEC